jgi:hypothetical protein
MNPITNSKKWLPLIVGLSLAIIHCAAVVWLIGQTVEGSWGGFSVFLLSFPVSIVSLLLPASAQLAANVAIGTLWWFAIGYFVTRFFQRVGASQAGA